MGERGLCVCGGMRDGEREMDGGIGECGELG